MATSTVGGMSMPGSPAGLSLGGNVLTESESESMATTMCPTPSFGVAASYAAQVAKGWTRA